MKKDMTDALHLKPGFRSYGSYLDELTPDDVYNGLVGFGMLSNKIPPALSSEAFLAYCQKEDHSFWDHWCPWIRLRYMHNVDDYRDFGIPNPFAYELLSAHIRDHWDEIKSALKKNTDADPYVVNKVHIRKLHNSSAIFDMNYSNWRTDYRPLPTLLVGKRYAVSCDISKCFPSIYIHAVDWAIRGKKVAKQNTRNRKGSKSSWSAKLDKLLSNTTYGETHGILIGPHASNIVSELILTSVDKKVMDKGFRFERAIDDYSCYVETYEQAEEFIFALDGALQEYGLALNQRKTKIEELPNAMSSSWVRKLRGFGLPSNELTYRDVSAFLDFSIETMKEANDNRAVLLYAMKAISHHSLSYGARKYYLDMGLHLICLYSYLMPNAEDLLFKPCHIQSDRLGIFLETMYDQGLKRRDFLTSTFSLYYAMRYDIKVASFVDTKENMIQSGDCLLLLFAWLYARENKEQSIENKLYNKAKTLAADDESFGRNWLFVYEVLNSNELSGSDWEAIKKYGVSFINYGILKGKSMVNDLED